MTALFVTGFPGFIGSALLPRLLAHRPDVEAVCLVQRRYRGLALDRAAALERADAALRGRIRLVEGDVTRPALGLQPSHRARLQRETTEIVHLAAVYDPTVAREVAMRVNVGGTRAVLDFAHGCPDLTRFQHVSTFAVGGHYVGCFTEDDLEKGQEFRNPYVETKYLAEVDVRRAMAEGLPATVYRPGMVVGDSDTGATQKLDGPYFLIRWLLRQPKGLAVVPVVGDPGRTRPNIVPRDFVVAAIAHLSRLEASRGVTYQLVDPEPPTLDELIDRLAEATGRRVLRPSVPLGLIQRALRLPGARTLVGIPAEAMDYFDHPTFFTCSHTLRDLAGTGVACPPFATYAARLVDFVERHPEVGAGPMT